MNSRETGPGIYSNYHINLSNLSEIHVLKLSTKLPDSPQPHLSAFQEHHHLHESEENYLKALMNDSGLYISAHISFIDILQYEIAQACERKGRI